MTVEINYQFNFDTVKFFFWDCLEISNIQINYLFSHELSLDNKNSILRKIENLELDPN